MPTAYLDFEKGSHSAPIWKFLKKLHARNMPMVTGCCNDNKVYKGISTRHAYSLLDLVHLSNGVRLAKIRNPWGSEKYHGEYSDSSPLWTPALK